jgi:hypothetical protein
MTKKHITEGYTLRGSDAYRFEHIASAQADELAEMAEFPHVVVTVNSTFSADKKSQHLNTYFAYSLPMAISLAAALTIESLETAERVVEIRAATPEEVQAFGKVLTRARAIEPLVIEASDL